MTWTNYHSHTQYCDGVGTPEEYVKAAINIGLKAYGFSAHAPVNFETEWCIPNHKFQEYIDDVRSIKNLHNSIEIYSGLEIDYIPGVAGRSKHIIKDIELDYYISSIHFVDCFANGEHWNIDTSKELFERGINEIFNGSFKMAAERFYELSMQMLEEEQPDIIGHLDKIKMYNTNNQYFGESESWYINLVDKLLNTIKTSGTIAEVNTRGYYRYGQTDLYPAQWIIRKMADMDIPIMLNSDCHAPDEITSGFKFAAQQLKECGVRKLWALIDGKWNGYDYNETGLLIL